MAETGKEVRARVADAWNNKRVYDRQLADIYRYIMPYRDTTGLFALNDKTEGQNRTDVIFDNTALSAGFRFAGRLQTELTPVFQTFFDLIAGPLLPDDDSKKALTEEFQRIGKIVSGVLASGSFAMRAHEMYLDLFAGTGAMYMSPGDEFDIVRFRTVPIPEISLEEGPYGDIWGINWRRQYRYRELKVMWPDGAFSVTLKKKIADAPADKVTIHQSTKYDPAERIWVLQVFAEGDDDDAIFHEEKSRLSRWIIPRFFVVPGEPYGRGPAHLALPSVKTVNKVRELALMAAAFAVLGLWTRRNDGVFNPDMVKFEPLAMWQVGSTGGPMGPTVQRLDVPHNFDVSSFVIEDERAQMKLALLDDGLPPAAGAVRSATEIAERMRVLSQDLGGVFGRLTLEIVKPVVENVIDILEAVGKLPTNIRIDQMITQVRVIAPIAAQQMAGKVSQTVNWLQMMGMLAGPQAAALACDMEKLFPEMGRWMGVEERFIRSEADQAKMQKMMAAVMAQSQQAQQAPQQQDVDPAAQFLNGGM